MNSGEKPTWSEYFLRMAELISTRSSCSARKVGAVIVVDKTVVSTGYNGTPRGIKNCDEGGCQRCEDRKLGKVKSGERLEECICVHAEANAVNQVARNGGPSIKGAVLYTMLFPCSYCAKNIINAGIVEVVYEGEYAHDPITEKLFKEAGVKFTKYEGTKE